MPFIKQNVTITGCKTSCAVSILKRHNSGGTIDLFCSSGWGKNVDTSYKNYHYHTYGKSHVRDS